MVLASLPVVPLALPIAPYLNVHIPWPRTHVATHSYVDLLSLPSKESHIELFDVAVMCKILVCFVI